MEDFNRRKTDGNRVVCLECKEVSPSDIATANIYREHNYGYICVDCRTKRLMDLRDQLENYDGK